MHDEVENYIILRRSWHKLDYHESLFKTKWTLIFLEKIKKSCSHLVVRAMDHERKKKTRFAHLLFVVQYVFFKKNINNYQNGLNSKCYYFIWFFVSFRKCRQSFLNFKSESDVNYASIAINWVAKVSGYVYHVFWNKQTNKKIKSFTVYIIVRYFVLMGIHSLCTKFKALLRISDFHRNILYIFNTVRLRLRFVDHSSIWKETFIQRKIGLARFSTIYFLK